MLAKTSSPTNENQNKKRKLSDTDLDEIPTDPKELKKWRKKQRRERKTREGSIKEAKQPKHIILKSGFYGEILIQPKKTAIAHAMEVLQSGDHPSLSPNIQNHVFWVDGSLPTGAAGAAVVYKDIASTESTEWIDHGFCITDIYDNNFVELFAIGAAMKIGISQIRKYGFSLSASCHLHTVKIFSDSVGAMCLIEIYSRMPEKLASLEMTTVVQKVFELSRQLHQMGATIKIHWVPGHSNIPAQDRVTHCVLLRKIGTVLVLCE